MSDAKREAGSCPPPRTDAGVWPESGAAADEELVFRNNREATLGALRAAVAGEPRGSAVVAAADEPANPFFRTGRV